MSLQEAVTTRYGDGARDRLESALVLVVFLISAAVIIAFGSVVSSQPFAGWYAESIKPAWDIPLWIRGTVWELVGMLTALGAWLVWRERRARVVSGALSLFVSQLLLNALWRPTFFALYPALGATALWLAALIALLMFVTVLAAVREFSRVKRSAAILLLPCLVWVGYILSLNIASALLN